MQPPKAISTTAKRIMAGYRDGSKDVRDRLKTKASKKELFNVSKANMVEGVFKPLESGGPSTLTNKLP